MAGERSAIFAGLYAGICFGVFWIPIRALEDVGFTGPWAMVVFAGLPLVICLPILWMKRGALGKPGLREMSGGLIGGVAFALYATAFLYTDIVRVIVMFYVMPAWGFLLAWLVMGDRMTVSRWVTLAMCFIGLYIVFGQHSGLPVPQNLGDWLAFMSGVFWALAALLILLYQRVSFLIHGTNFFASAMVICLIAACVAVAQGQLAAPDWSELGSILFWVLPVSLLLVLPAGLATVFAPSRLNPGVAGLLFMTEVVVAAVTAAVWANEPLGAREISGLVLIMAAGLIEPAKMTLWKGEKV